MKICHIAAEYAPFVKVGGLADALFGMTEQLLKEGHIIEILLPFYSLIDKKKLQNLHLVLENFHSCRIWQSKENNLILTFIDPIEKDYFKSNKVYEGERDAERFLDFSLICHEYLKLQNPDIVHLHDWHTAFVSFLNQGHYYPTLFTIHNFAYQGLFGEEPFRKLDIPLTTVTSLKEGDHYNLMKGAILYADHITTVSKSYAQEIISTSLGGELQPLLFTHKEKISGIINGIDNDFWDPEKDPYLPQNFSHHQLKNKQKLKEYVKKFFNLKSEKDFLVSSITRLVPQKGPELIIEAIKEVQALGGSYLLLGSAFDPKIEAEFIALKNHFSNDPSLYFQLVYDESLSHLVFGASDLFVMPSHFEPCGLTQLIALRYGTLPLVRETGGLKDTIHEGKNGFSFQEATPQAIKQCVQRAFALWENNKNEWDKLIERAMSEDHSWKIGIQEYLVLYATVISSRKSKDAIHTLD